MGKDMKLAPANATLLTLHPSIVWHSFPRRLIFLVDEEQGVWGLPGPATRGLLKRGAFDCINTVSAVETPDVGYFWVARIYLDDRVLDNVEKSFVVRAKAFPISFVFVIQTWSGTYCS